MALAKVIARALALGPALLFAGAAAAQVPGYPDRPVKIIVPFAAAGPTDVVARLIAQKLSEKYGHQFYIENMTGAGGNLGMGTAAKATGDGYTILFVSSSRRLAQRVVRASRHPGAIGEGACRAHPRQSRQVHVRLPRHRHDAASLQRAVQAHLRA